MSERLSVAGLPVADLTTLPGTDLTTLPGTAPTTPPPVRGRARRVLSAIPPAVVFGLALGAWYLGSYVLVDPDVRFLLPTPDEVVRVAFLDPDNLNELMTALALSAQVALTGLVLASVIGLGLAVMMSQSRWLERSLYPYAVVLQTMPILALIPLFGYWFGFGFTSRVLVCVLIALFPIVANGLFGLRSVDPGMHELFTVHRASRLTRLIKLQLPAALPAIFTGLRIAAGASVIGAIVGDFFFQQGQPGIGQLIYIYPKQLRSEMLFGAIILASLFGLTVFWFFGLIARRVSAWHESAHDHIKVPITSR
jgi:NitT/TauT family transport system permease protein